MEERYIAKIDDGKCYIAKIDDGEYYIVKIDDGEHYIACLEGPNKKNNKRKSISNVLIFL
jgi:hypothetical protein